MMTTPRADESPLGEYFELSTHLIALDVQRRGYEPQWLRPAMFVVDIDGVMHGWNMTRCNITSTVAVQVTSSKRYTRRLLRSAGLAVAQGWTFSAADFDRAFERIQRTGWPVVVKPVGRGGSKGVTVGVGNEGEFRSAWQAAEAREILVERQFEGEEARFLTIGGRCVAVCGQRRPNVVGDGLSTISQLVAVKHQAREENPHLRGKTLDLTEARTNFLGKEGLTGDSVPAPDQIVWLEDRGGIAGRPSIWRTGADSVDMTDSVHPSYKEIAERAESAIPGLGFCGVDIIARDYSVPATPDNYIILEVNSRPAIGAHHFPWEGAPRDVARAIVDECIARGS